MDAGSYYSVNDNASISIEVSVIPSAQTSQISIQSEITKDAEALKVISQDKDAKIEGFKMLIVMAIPLATAIIISAFALEEARKVTSQVAYSANTIDVTFSIIPLISNLQKERGLTSIYLSSGKNIKIRKDLSDVFKNVNSRMKSVFLQNDKYSFTILEVHIGGAFYNEANISDYIEQHRISIFEGEMSLEKNLELYTSIIKGLINGMAFIVDLPIGDRVWKTYVSIKALLQTTDSVGLQRAIGSVYLASCVMSSGNAIKMIQLNAERRSYMSIANRYSSIGQRRVRMIGNNDIMTILEKEINDKGVMCENMTAGERLLKSNQWFNATTNRISTLLEYIDSDVLTLKQLLQKIISKANKELLLYSVIIVSVCIGSLSLGSCYSYSIYKMIEKVMTYTLKLSSEKKDLAKEKKRFDNILHQLLPKDIAGDLKNNRPIIPEYYENVTVYFHDIVGFTTICSKCSPNQIVDLLSELYSLVDSVIEKYDAYKLETVGDAYVVASGLPKRNGMQHVKEIADMSLEIQSKVLGYSTPQDPNQNILLRAGIHSGPAAAGVVGRIMPKYCLFGETIHIANQMESSGEASKIHMSETTASMLDMHRGYSKSKAGQVKIKGHVILNTYWLLGHSEVVNYED